MRLQANTELSGVGLSAAQKTKLLTVIVADADYSESALSSEQFELFREATLHALDKEPARNRTRFETKLRPWEGLNLKVSGVQILQKVLKFDGLDPGETRGPGCRPAASGGVQPLAENNILAHCQA